MTARSFDRIRRMPPQELRWRATVALRTTAQRVGVSLRRPRWDRSRLRRVLSSDVLDGTMRVAIARQDWEQAHASLVAAIGRRKNRFLLDPGSFDRVRDAVITRWPDAPSRAATRADDVLAGRYDILGYRSLIAPAGNGEWHRDPVHDRCAPRLFWADVPYLDPAIGDHKVIWEINRHQHWLQLGRALWLTGNARYADGLVERLGSWLADNPPLIGINWASMLEIGFRAMSWAWALHFLLAHGSSPQGSASRGPWLVDMLVALHRQLAHLEQNLSHYFSPNTHLTGEALALYVVGVALPELAGSGRWVHTGRRILIAEIDRQIHADGGHAERSTHYQRYTLDFYLCALLTARLAGDTEAIARFTDAASRLADFTRVIADDRGRLPLIGDDDGGVLWPMTGRECNDVRDSLALAAAVLARPELAPWDVPEEVWWIAGESANALEAITGRRDAAPAPPSRAFGDTGYVVARDGAGGHAVLNTGAHGYLNGGHAHADALAITLSLAHQPLLVDPGTSTYTMSPALRDRMRSSMSHNTVTLDERSSAIPAGPFTWHTRADARLHASRHNPAFDWVESSHDGYAPMRHRRALFRSRESGWLVVDEILGDGLHSADSHWHFDPSWTVRQAAPSQLRATHVNGQAAWMLFDVGTATLVRGDSTHGLGWHAPVYGTLVPAWTARVTHRQAAPFALITWIGPAGRDADTPPFLQRLDATSDSAPATIATRLVAGDLASVCVMQPGRPAQQRAPMCAVLDYETDARVLHYVTRGDRLVALDLVDGTGVVARRGHPINVACASMVADLRISVDGTALALSASVPPSELRIHGELTRVDLVRLNGREMPRPSGAPSGAWLIHASDWAERPLPVGSCLVTDRRTTCQLESNSQGDQS